MVEYTVVDLFAGAGGLSEGFHRASGFHTVAAVESDPCAAATYAANHPNTAVHADDVAEWLKGSVGHAAIVVGGPPCQGFSNLGARRVRDPRNALWRRYVDALHRVQPALFVLENVADFLRSGQYRDLRRETGPRGRLAGYRVEAYVLNAADYGAAQIRRRAVVIGSLLELRPPGPPAVRIADRREWRTVRDVIGDLSPEVVDTALPMTRTMVGGIMQPGAFKTTELHLGRRPTELSLARYRAIPAGGNRHDLPDELSSRCWRGHRAGSGDVMGRLHWDRPSVTIRTEFWKPEKGRYLHPEQHRAITHHEAARLQGFPDDYLWVGSKTAIGRQIGNAVPIPLAEALADHLRTQLV